MLPLAVDIPLIALLVIALGASLSWGYRLRRQRAQPARRTAQRLDGGPTESQLQVALEAVDSGVVLIDAADQVRYCNGRALQLLDTQAEYVLGRSPIILLRDHRADALVREALETREERNDVLHPARSRQTLSLRCLPTADGAVLLLIRDLTQLNQLERARRDLLANVSHDLRTPLASLRLLVETLQREPPPELAARMLRQMGGELDDITRLVDELYELSQLESGRLALQLAPVPAQALIERLIERISPQAEQHQQQLEMRVPDDLPPLLIDRPRIEQALLNLLRNAVKFTPDQGRITITAQLGPEDEHGRWVELVVIDTGPGIPQDALSRIFERFYKVDRSRTRGSGGVGLGLAIAKHIIEGHGGRIWAESPPGQGSHFHALLPVAE